MFQLMDLTFGPKPLYLFIYSQGVLVL